MMDLRLPFITAKDSEGQLKQMQSYLYQLVGDLNHAMVEVEKEQQRIDEVQKQSISASESPKAIENTFLQLKELIIKSGDIVEAYAEQISILLEGKYVLASDFGTYQESVAANFELTQSGITQNYEHIQTLNSVIDVDGEGSNVSILSTNAYIKTGLLDGTTYPPTYGIEVGQRSEQDGQSLLNKYARFTPSGIYFYLTEDTPTAYFQNDTMYIKYAQITQGARFGGYILDFTDGIAWKWAT